MRRTPADMHASYECDCGLPYKLLVCQKQTQDGIIPYRVSSHREPWRNSKLFLNIF